jgi:branched-chain amino acid aminotransferase
MDYAYFDGKFVPFDEAKLSIRTHAFLYGTSIFEGIRGYWVPEESSICIFRMKEHFERLLRNSKMFYLTPEFSVQDLEKLTIELIQRNAPTTDTYIRPTLFKNGQVITPRLDHTITDFCMWSAPLGNYVDIEKGLKVCVSSWRRVDDNAIPPRAKAAGAYMNSALIVTDARNMGFDDAVVLNPDGTVSEGSAMNLFLVRDGRLITPGRCDNILEGITRDSIITLAKEELGIETEERVVDRTEIYMADEAFYSGTGAQVAPIASFDMRPVGDGHIGPISKKIQELYFKVVKNKLPKYSHWCTMVPIEQKVSA